MFYSTTKYYCFPIILKNYISLTAFLAFEVFETYLLILPTTCQPTIILYDYRSVLKTYLVDRRKILLEYVLLIGNGRRALHY